MHGNCKYSFKSKIAKTRSVYSALSDNNVNIEYTIECTMCGLNPSSIKLSEGQPLCSDFELKEEKNV